MPAAAQPDYDPFRDRSGEPSPPRPTPTRPTLGRVNAGGVVGGLPMMIAGGTLIAVTGGACLKLWIFLLIAGAVTFVRGLLGKTDD